MSNLEDISSSPDSPRFDKELSEFYGSFMKLKLLNKSP